MTPNLGDVLVLFVLKHDLITIPSETPQSPKEAS